MRKPFHIRRWTWAHRFTAALFLLALILGRAENFSWVKGSLSATRLANVLWLADPLAALEVMLATMSVPLNLLVAAGILVVVYAVFGRAFCGWVCPLGLVLDVNDDVRARVTRIVRQRGWLLPTWNVPASIKSILLALVLVVSATSQLPAFQLVSPINLMARALIFAPGWEMIFVAAIVAFEYGAPRAWCRALCPLGAFYSVLGRLAPVRIVIDQKKEQAGKQCGLCAYHCPMQIAVLDEHIRKGKPTLDDPECTRCGACMDGCPRDSLRMGIGR